ncbi:hypothetical protein GCM10011369_18310 [Neiella marina]|uniref:Uncharacterized protein n=1 Tax=Neiella marina TaxID=508461 RepID=A0A8J2XP25_9GAMM|nr:hypothetical protein [Neiella marina]GGA76736.1 hypothetical protein GCM10011369_18310 [Neiella marina]
MHWAGDGVLAEVAVKKQKLLLQLMFSTLLLLVIIGGGFLSNLLEKVESIDDQIRFQQRKAPEPSSRVGIASAGLHRTVIVMAGQVKPSTDENLHLELTFFNADPYQSIVIDSIELFDQGGVSVALLATGQNMIAPQAAFNKKLSLQYLVASSVTSCVISWRINDWTAMPVSYLLLPADTAGGLKQRLIYGAHRAVL